MAAVSAPLRYHGGKSYQAKRIIKLMPPHDRFTEACFGGGSVLFAKPPEGIAEFVNDLHGELMDFYRVLRDEETFAQFQRRVEATPLSQVEFESAKTTLDDEKASKLERAVAFFVRYRQSRQGLAKCFVTPTSRTRRGMNEQVSAWLTCVDRLPEAHARLRRVEIRNQEAVQFIQELDSPETLHYVDPPYLAETRTATKCYEHEMTTQQHQRLLDVLSQVKGKFILSGYPSQLYDAAAKAANWNCSDTLIDNKSSNAKQKAVKTERLWMNF